MDISIADLTKLPVARALADYVSSLAKKAQSGQKLTELEVAVLASAVSGIMK